MKTNKNIDRLFQEKFKELEVTPPQKVWSDIESNLHEKSNTYKIPLWMKVSSAAAILLLLTIGAMNYFDNPKSDIIITDIDSKELPSKIDNSINNDEFNNDDNNTIITNVDQGEIQNNNEIESLNRTQSSSSNNNKFKEESNSVISSVNDKNDNKNTNSNNSFKDINSEDFKDVNSSIIANNSKDVNKNNLEDRFENQQKNGSDSFIKTNATITTNIDNIDYNNTSIQIATNKNKFEKILSTIENYVSDNNLKNESTIANLSNQNNAFNKFDSKDETKFNSTQKNTIAENKDFNIDVSKALKDAENKEKNQEVVAQNIENLEELFPNTEDEKDKEKEENLNKWSVSSNIAPIFYNSFNTKGSPLDLQFKNSPKTGSKSVSYGIKFGYQLNKKLTLQSGISKMDVGYRIGDVFINPTQQQEAKLANISYNNSGVILNVNAENYIDNPSVETSSSIPIKGTLDQVFGYIEVPLELKYRLTNNESKIGINLIGGFSTMFLDKNEVFVTTDEFSSNLGEANNLNNVNFSGNLGLDLDYKINKKIFINVAPTLKIHANTFSNSDKNFKPYLFGVYTGLNYRF